jgi:hypothetical protein
VGRRRRGARTKRPANGLASTGKASPSLWIPRVDRQCLRSVIVYFVLRESVRGRHRCSILPRAAWRAARIGSSRARVVTRSPFDDSNWPKLEALFGYAGSVTRVNHLQPGGHAITVSAQREGSASQEQQLPSHACTCVTSL